MSIFRNKYFYLNIFLAIALLIALLAGTLASLKAFTRHGEEIVLPNFEGEPITSLQTFVRENHLRYTVIDSVYNDNLAPGTIVLQDPYPFSKVKTGRKIYVSVVSSLPESVVMPDVVNLSVRQAVSLIYGNDLTVDKLIFKSGFDKNSVQEQLIDGQAIEAGTKLPKFTPITLAVSSGNQSGFTKAPNIIGLTKADAIQRIYQHSFNVGSISGDAPNAEGLKVVAQNPKSSNTNTYPLGYKINFVLSSNGKVADSALLWNDSYQAGIDTSLMIYMQEELEEILKRDSLENAEDEDFLLDDDVDNDFLDDDEPEDIIEEDF